MYSTITDNKNIKTTKLILHGCFSCRKIPCMGIALYKSGDEIVGSTESLWIDTSSFEYRLTIRCADWLLTLSAHAQEGCSKSSCLSICLVC